MKSKFISIGMLPGHRNILVAAVVSVILLSPSALFAQGSIYGTVQNTDLTTPANGEISFVGFLDDTDEEIRIETSDGAGYDSGNWFDDFQNYLTEAAGNPYDYYFYNSTNGEAYHLAKLIPANSFQEENILLATASLPLAPTNLAADAISTSSMLVTWDGSAGLTYHVYRRNATSNGSFFRIDNVSGDLSDPGVSTTYFVDTTVDGVSSYTYLVIAENTSGDYSAHSSPITGNSSVPVAPVVNSIVPSSGVTVGSEPVTIYGVGFDQAGAGVTMGGSPATSIVVVSPMEITALTPAGTGTVDVVVTNTLSGLTGTLGSGFSYFVNNTPVADAGTDQLGQFKNILITLDGSGSSDIDLDSLGYHWSQASGPETVVLSDSNAVDPSFTAYTNGDYYFDLTVDDGLAESAVDQVYIQIVERAPVLTAIGSQSVTEGDNLNFGVTATDPDGTNPALTAENVPTNATFTDNGDGTGTFDFNPSYTQANTYNVRFIASDGILADTEMVTITVNEAGNQAPVLASIGSQVVTEATNLNFGISATDPDGTTPSFTAEDVPANATFTDNGNGTGTFDFNPDYTQGGNVYNVRFIASDGALTDTEMVAITVNEAGNQAPVLASIGSQSVTEGDNLNFGVSATDPDATTPALTAEDVPTNATFTDNGNGTGTFDFNPDYTQAASYDVRFIASDGALADTEVVTITVNEAGNQAPVLASIGSQSVTEGDNLNFGISASDPDATTPTLTAEDVPTNATFTDNGNGTGTFDFDPDYTQANTYDVRFIASDGALADTEVVTITVNEAGNQAPVLASIGSQSVTEGDNMNFGVSATDPDATTPTLTAEDVPTNATFTDNGNGTGTFNFDPDYTQASTYDVRFIASDGVLADTEVVTITVDEAGNQTPVLAFIGSQSVTEGDNLNFGVSATDPDATIPTLTAENVPANATFVDNLDGTGTFDFNPDYTQAASYDVRFIASDGALADTEVVTITVDEAGNQAPVLASIGSQSVNEGDNLNFGISASDPDATTPTLTAENVPTNASFTDNGNGTGTFDFDPDYTQASVYNVRFIASDGVLADTEIVAITVNDAGNQAPLLASIGSQLVDEGSNLNFGISASDPDATIPTLLAEDVPANATFTDNLDGTGTFNFDPDFTQGGSTYDVRFIATDGALADTEVVSITVNEAGNQAPVLALIGPQTMTEGDNLNIVVSAADPDATIPALTAEDLPANATFVDHNDGTGTFDFNPDYIQASTYFVRFIAFDGALADTEIVQIVVNEAGNQAPLLATIGAQSVTEGETLNFVVTATDPDTTTPSLAAEDLPTNAAFVENGDGTGTFDFNPDYTQAGAYDVRFIAFDGVLSDTEIVTITVNDAGNQAPVLADIGPHGVTEGSNLNFVILASDPDTTIPTLLAEDIPANATFVDNLDGTGTFDFNPDFTQGGNVYSVRFIATDGALADTEVVDITVADEGNQKPLMAPVPPQAIVEGDSLFVGVSASDPDGTTPQLVAQDLPENATFADNGDGSGSFIFKPNYVQSGDYTVRFIASDGVLTDTALMDVSVLEAGNQAPIIAEIDSQFVDEGTSLDLIISVTDPDTTIPSLIAENLPLNSTFIDNADGTGTFDFLPDFDQAGEFIWQVIASDGILDDTADVIVTVNHINVPPVLDSIGPRVVNVGDTLTITVTASDFDGTIPTLDADSLPVNATFTDLLDGSGEFVFETDITQEGVYNVIFVASDGEFADSETVQISVTDYNQPPVFATVAPQVVNENITLNIPVSATDPEGHGIALFMLDGPENTTFVDSGGGIGLVKFKPNYYQAGEYEISIAAIDDGDPEESSVLDIPVTVNDVNRPPVFQSVGPQSVLLGDSLMLRLVAVDSTDPDGGELFISALKKPANSTLIDSTGGIAGFIFKPVLSQVGVDTAKFICFDDEDPALAGQLSVEITTVLTNLPPELLEIGPQTVTEADTLEFNIYAIDSDGPSITLYTDTLPNNATFVDSGNGVGTFTFMPDFMQSGLKSVKFYATDGIATDMETVLIQVYDNPQPPMLVVPNDTTIIEGEVLSVEILATDPDSTIPSIRMDTLVMPLNMIFGDNGDGSASFQFAPEYVQAGTYDFTFIAEDDSDMADTAVYTVTVDDAGNQTPVFTHFMIGAEYHVFPDTLYLTEGQSITFAVFTTDADSVMPVLSATGLSGSATFEDNLDWSGTFDWETDNFTAGTHAITFIAEDGSDPLIADSAEVVIIIDNVNNAPSSLFIWKDGSLVQTSWEEEYPINEGETHTFLIEMADPDSTYPVLSIVALDAGPTDTIPVGMFDNVTTYDSANGYGTLTFSPDFYQARFDPYPFRIRAIDVDDDSMYIEKILLIKVENVPQDPVLDPIPQNIQITEGDSLELVISYSDADIPVGQFLTLSWTPELTNAGAANIDGNSSLFHFYPWYDQAGNYELLFRVEENAFSWDTQTVAIEVLEAGPQPPILFVPFAPEDTVDLGSPFNERIWALDPEGGSVTLTALNLPLNAAFVDSSNGAGGFVFDPDLSQADATYDISFVASDGTLADTVQASLYVREFICGDVNQSSEVDIDDIVYLITWIFGGGPAPTPLISGDVHRTNCPDVVVDIDDVTHLVTYIFGGGAAPDCTCP